MIFRTISGLKIFLLYLYLNNKAKFTNDEILREDKIMANILVW